MIYLLAAPCPRSFPWPPSHTLAISSNLLRLLLYLLQIISKANDERLVEGWAQNIACLSYLFVFILPGVLRRHLSFIFDWPDRGQLLCDHLVPWPLLPCRQLLQPPPPPPPPPHSSSPLSRPPSSPANTMYVKVKDKILKGWQEQNIARSSYLFFRGCLILYRFHHDRLRLGQILHLISARFLVGRRGHRCCLLLFYSPLPHFFSPEIQKTNDKRLAGTGGRARTGRRWMLVVLTFLFCDCRCFGFWS